MSVSQWDQTKYMTIHMNERLTRFDIDSGNLPINKRRKNRMPFWSVGGGKCEVIISARTKSPIADCIACCSRTFRLQILLNGGFAGDFSYETGALVVVGIGEGMEKWLIMGVMGWVMMG